LVAVAPKPKHQHGIDTSFTAILIDEKRQCTIGGIDVSGILKAQVTTKVKVDTSFGFILITKLGLPLDLTGSYLYFKNQGAVTAQFTLDAAAMAKFQREWELFGLDKFPGATFSVPGIVTIGPNFKLFASVDASVTLAAHLESNVEIASWDIQQTYPDQGSTYEPKALDSPDADDTGILGKPSFDYSIRSTGQLTTHLKPTILFGIDFTPIWKVPSCKVNLVADGWVRFIAEAEFSSTNQNCPFKYIIDAGADLYASLDAPSVFGWDLAVPRYNLGSLTPRQIVTGGSCPEVRENAFDRRALEAGPSWSALEQHDALGNATMKLAPGGLHKRAGVIGPFVKLPPNVLSCPNSAAPQSKCEALPAWDTSEVNSDEQIVARRDIQLRDMHLEKREKKQLNYCGFSTKYITSPDIDSSGDIIKVSISFHPNIQSRPCQLSTPLCRVYQL
jgi:chitinase